MSVHRELMELAIEVARSSKRETREDPPPSVGAVLARDMEIVATAYRGQSGPGDHAEYALLRGLEGQDLRGTTLYVTLEPCTRRTPPKEPCAQWIIDRGVGEVVIGMIDPNRTIQGDGFWALSERGIAVSFFDQDLTQQLTRYNADFIKWHRPLTWMPPSTLRSLDDWYAAINSIYLDRNLPRAPEWMFAHLVEVIGGVSTVVSGKAKTGTTLESYIPKSLGWWFALCGVLGVRSVEELLWRKFPGVCPYCRERPHENRKCTQMKGANKNPDWNALSLIAAGARRPRTANDWKQQFDAIYPASQAEGYEMVFARLTEELGELAECVRVFNVVPTTFLSEAADVFAWVMKLANLYEQKAGRDMNLNTLLWENYPDRCLDCNSRVCSCSPVLPSTVRRIAHEGPPVETLNREGRSPFLSSTERLARFEVGSSRLVIGKFSAPTDAATREQVHRLAREFQFQILSLDGLPVRLRDSLETWAITVAGLVTSQRVSQRVIDEFSLRLSTMDSQTRSVVRVALTRCTESPVRGAFIEYLDTLEEGNPSQGSV